MAPARNEAQTRYVAAVRRLAVAAADRGDASTAADLGRRLVAVDRYDDASHRLLVDALLAGGEIGAARRAHEAWTAAMADLDVTVAPFDPS